MENYSPDCHTTSLLIAHPAYIKLWVKICMSRNTCISKPASSTEDAHVGIVQMLHFTASFQDISNIHLVPPYRLVMV